MGKRKQLSNTHACNVQLETVAPSGLQDRVTAGAALIIVVAFLAYLPSLSGSFLMDDDCLLTENKIIQASDGLYRIWFTTEAADYWPITNTSWWIEWRIWGMHPAGYRITNWILSVTAAMLIWIILKKLAIPGAFLSAMIFAVHPVNVESVAWIAQRKNMMAIVFFLLSILFYLKLEIASSPLHKSANRNVLAHASRPSPLWYWLSLAAFVLAMLGKGSVVILPVLLLLIICWMRPLTRQDLARTSPFFAIAAVLAIVNVWFQTHGSDTVVRTASFAERLLGAGGVVWFYLYKAIFPLDLAFIYPQWNIQADYLLWWLPLLATLAVTAILYRFKESWGRPYLFAWAFFCAGLVPVMGFTDVGFMQYSLVADHYQHIAIIGVIALASAFWSDWHQRVREEPRLVVTVVAVMVVGTLTFLTWRQSSLYCDEISLYKATLGKNPACWVVHYNLGNALSRAKQLPEAIESYHQALRLKHDYIDAHNNLGIALAKANRYQEAIEHYQQVLHLNPNSSEVYNNLGNILLRNLEQPHKAIEHFRQALRLKPNYPDALNNLGAALIQVGRSEEAIEYCDKALQLKPDNPDFHHNLGNALIQTGKPEEAIAHYRQALNLKPDFSETLHNLGAALFQTDQTLEAIKYLKQALQINPNDVIACNNLAFAYAKINQSSEAIAMAQKALELARSQGQMDLAKQIEDWLNSYQGQATADVAPGDEERDEKDDKRGKITGDKEQD